QYYCSAWDSSLSGPIF
nr:immunoglobulin light chain junction region [Macaca mulatta]MOW69023.1 immunoglobulin light chain junction region [Macaca mulatta]MOW72333.1 immunoglobulin light chain junction region [Macaca mulatta]